MRAILFAFALALVPGAVHSAASAKKAPKVVVRKTPQLILKESIASHLDLKSRQEYFESVHDAGYSGIDLEIVDSTGTYYFSSVSLNQLGWPSGGDALLGMSAAWSRLAKTKGAPKVGFTLDLSNLARLVGAEDLPQDVARPSVNHIDDVIFGLMSQYRSGEVSFTCYPPEYMPVALGSFRNARRALNLVAAPPYFDRYAASPEFDEDSLRAFAQRITVAEADLSDPARLGRDDHSIGYANLMFAWAATLQEEVWYDLGFEHPSWRNLVLFRVAQYAPHGLVGRADDYNHLNFSGLKGDIDEFYGYSQNVSPAGRKIANLVMGAKKERPEPLISEYIDPIMNALQANGYEVRVTFGKMLEKADLYYVVNGEDWLADAPFFDSIVDLMDTPRSHFYGTVILHPMGEITNAGAWARVREMFHLPNAEGGWISGLPENVMIKMIPFDWGLGRGAEGRGMTRIRTIQAKNFGADVILSEVYDGATLGLIFKSGGHYLVNGNFLKLGAGFFLSKLIGGAIQAPAPVYVTANRKRTAALAVGEARLKLKLPVPDPRGEWTLNHFAADGERLRSESIPAHETIDFEMKPFELLILKTEP